MFSAPIKFNSVIVMCFGIWGQVAVITFIVISSYFLSDKRGIHFSRLAVMLMQAVTISLLLFILAGAVGLTEFTASNIIKEVIKSLISPFSGKWWFMTTYIYFYLLIPVLQFVVQTVIRKSMKAICLVLLIAVSVVDFLHRAVGGALLDFIMIFFLISYIKRYREEEMKKYCGRIFVITSLGIFCGTLILSILENLILGYCSSYHLGHIFVNWNPVLCLCSISLFYLFKNGLEGCGTRYNRVINVISGASFGVYLLHENNWFGGSDSYLWCELFDLDSAFGTNSFAIRFVAAVAIVYLICAFIEIIRIFLIDKIVFEKVIYKKFEPYFHRADTGYIIELKQLDQSELEV